MVFVSRSIFSYFIQSLCVAGFLTAALGAPAYANHNTTYLSIEGTALNVHSNSLGTSFDPFGVRVKVGTRLSPAFDVEAQFAASSDDSNGLLDQLDATLAGVYLKGYLPLGFRSSLYALGGYSWAKFTTHSFEQEIVDRQSGFSYGVGVETQIARNIDLSADFTSYSQEGGEYDDVSSFSFGVKVYF